MFKLLTVTFLIRWTLLLAFTYEVQLENYDMFAPCNDYPDNFLDKFLLMPDNITLLPDGNTYVCGDVVLTYDFQPLMKYPAKVEIYKRERGEWQKTLYTVQRENACTALFNPSEVWHSAVKDIPEEQRTCPFKKGQTFSLDLIFNPVLELTAKMEGDYRGRLEVGTTTPPGSPFLCAEVDFTMYRV